MSVLLELGSLLDVVVAESAGELVCEGSDVVGLVVSVSDESEAVAGADVSGLEVVTAVVSGATVVASTADPAG